MELNNIKQKGKNRGLRLFLFIFMLCSVWSFAQQNGANQKLQKDPFFSQNPAQVPAQAPGKIELKSADSTNVRPDQYDGNPFFKGHVVLTHDGSVLRADVVVLYQAENFAKALGNVELTNPDGTTLTADEAEYDGNTKKAIATGNVVLTDPQQRIETDKLYYDRNLGTAYFNTGGTIHVYQNNSTIRTQLGTYYVREQRIVFDSQYRIVDPDYITEGTKVNYFRGQGLAIFNGPTTVSNRLNPSNYVFTKEGKYNMVTKEVYLEKDSYIHYNGKILTGDTMYFNQLIGFGTAKGNVKLDDPAERRLLLGGHGEIYEKVDSAVVEEKPYAIKIFEKDSAYIAANKIIAYQKLDSTGAKKSFLRAFKQARMFKTNGQGRSDSLAYNETDGIMHFIGDPIFWTGEKQVTGDTIRAYSNPQLEMVDSIYVRGNAFAISKADSLNLKDEFNQVKGSLISVYFKDNKLIRSKVVGNALALAYVDNQDAKTHTTERIGINYSTCGIIDVGFLDQKVETVDCEIGALSDTYPMSMISHKQRFLEGYNWNTQDRLQKWQDIFLESPEYPETQYESDDSLYDAAQGIIQREQEKREALKPKRTKKE